MCGREEGAEENDICFNFLPVSASVLCCFSVVLYVQEGDVYCVGREGGMELERYRQKGVRTK